MRVLRSRWFLFVVGVVVLWWAFTGGPFGRKFWRATSIARLVVMEGPSGLIVLTPVHRSSKGGILADSIEGPVDYLFRSDVGPDGSVRTREYRPRRYLAVRLARPGVFGDDLYLLEWPDSTESQLMKLDPGGRIAPASPAECDDFRDPGHSPEWIRLKEHRSTRYAIAINEEREGDHTRIVAESTLEGRPWRRVLVDVDTRPWYARRRYDDLEDR